MAMDKRLHSSNVLISWFVLASLCVNVQELAPLGVLATILLIQWHLGGVTVSSSIDK